MSYKPLAFGNYNFVVECLASESKYKRVFMGGFSKVYGIESEIEYDTYQEGGVNNFVHIFPKSVDNKKVVMEKGVSTKNSFISWYHDVIGGKIEKRDLYISVYDQEDELKKTWHFTNAFPVKWSGPDLDALSNDVAIESVEFVYEEVSEE